MMRAASAVLGAALALAPGPARAIDVPHLVDEAGRAGVEHRYRGGWEFYVGGGVAVFDCSGDGFPDLYLAGGAGPAALFRNASPRGGPLAFERVPDGPASLGGVTGAYPLDVDGDGHLDLFVLRVGANAILRGLGDCRFERANERLGFEGGNAWSTAFSAVWETGERLPTLAVGDYVDRTAAGAPFGTCHDNALHRPGANDRYGPPVVLRPGYCALSMLFSDWNRDGVPDLRISNDRQYYRGGSEQLVRVAPSVPPRAYGRGEGWRELKIWGMGIASHDLTGDGYPEYFLTSMADNKLQALAGGAAFGAVGAELEPAYEDIAFRLGATVHRPYVGGETMPSTAWHAEFGDLNNDGFVDLFVAKGNVEGMLDFAARDPNNLLLGQADGSFREAAPEAGFVTFERARGGALADLDLDGLLDVVVVNREAPAEIWRNLGSRRAGPAAAGETAPSRLMGGFAAIRLEQPGPNRNAVGAFVEVRAGARVWRKEVAVGGGHASGSAGFVHFGIGTAELYEVRVQWPDGEWGPWVRSFANAFALVRRHEARPTFWYPADVAGPAAPISSTAAPASPIDRSSGARLPSGRNENDERVAARSDPRREEDR